LELPATGAAPPGPFTPPVETPGLPGYAAPLTAPDASGGVRVGLLLPLSGRGANIGRAMLDAAMLALADLQEDGLTLLARDTGGTPEKAAEAAEAVLQEGAQLILGPLFRESVLSVAPLARARGVNVIAFSTDAAIAGDGIYLLGFTPAGQLDRVIAYAVAQGLGRYAALAPATPYGDAVLAALQASLARRGGDLIRVETYAADGADAAQAIRRLASVRNPAPPPAPAGRRNAPPPNPFNFDAVVLPEGGDTLRRVAPLLPYYDVDPSAVRYIGTGLWDDPTIGREPAMIGGWFAAPPPDARRAFLERFRGVYGIEPPRLASLAYDATALAVALGRAAGGPHYDAGSLTQRSGFQGVDGLFRFDATGVAERGLAVLEIRSDGVRVVDPAPETFDPFGS